MTGLPSVQAGVSPVVVVAGGGFGPGFDRLFWPVVVVLICWWDQFRFSQVYCLFVDKFVRGLSVSPTSRCRSTVMTDDDDDVGCFGRFGGGEFVRSSVR